MTREELESRRDEILDIARRHGATCVRVFGSTVRGDSNAESDVDLLVDLEPGRSLFDLGFVGKLEKGWPGLDRREAPVLQSPGLRKASSPGHPSFSAVFRQSLGAMHVDLEELLGCRVDLVTENGLHWYVRDRVKQEAVPL